MVNGKKTQKREKRTRKKKTWKREKKTYMGKPKTMQKDLHTPHMCRIFLIWRYVVFKVSRLGVLPLILSQIKFANLAQSKGFMYYGNMCCEDFKRGVQN